MFEEAQPGFGGELPKAVHALMQQAAEQYTDTARAEALLQQALAAAPNRLAVYFGLYKFLFYKRRLADAELVVRRAMHEAATQGGFGADWTLLHPDPASTKWSAADEPTHFYLFCLKALAFIRLRRGDPAQCRAILDKLHELDPHDAVGASVVADMLHALA